MPSAIVEAVGSASANSYVTQAEATTYLGDRLNSSAWTDAPSDDKDRALIEAAREMQLLPWDGARTDGTQALAWPRDYVPDPDTPLADPAQDYPYYANTVIPQRVKDAQCELALEFLKAGTTDLAVADPAAGIKRERVDVLETEYDTSVSRPLGLAKFQRALGLLAPLLDGAGMLVRM